MDCSVRRCTSLPTDSESPPQSGKFEEALWLREAHDEVDVTVRAGFLAGKGADNRHMDDARTLQNREDLPGEVPGNPAVSAHGDACDHSFPLKRIIDNPDTPAGNDTERDGARLIFRPSEKILSFLQFEGAATLHFLVFPDLSHFVS